MAAAGANLSPTNLTLLIPGLFGRQGSPNHCPRLPALEACLARAEAEVGLARGFESALFQLFGSETPTEDDLPVAAVTRVLDMGVIDNGWWLRADPVHLRPERDRLVLTDSQKLDITRTKPTGSWPRIMEHYKADGWLLKAARPRALVSQTAARTEDDHHAAAGSNRA